MWKILISLKSIVISSEIINKLVSLLKLQAMKYLDTIIVVTSVRIKIDTKLVVQ